MSGVEPVICKKKATGEIYNVIDKVKVKSGKKDYILIIVRLVNYGFKNAYLLEDFNNKFISDIT